MNCCNDHGTCHQGAHCAARQKTACHSTTPTQAMPWLDDITPTGPIADELDDMDDLWLADVALVVLAGSALIFCAGFGLGYLTGGG